MIIKKSFLYNMWIRVKHNRQLCFRLESHQISEHLQSKSQDKF